MITQRDSFWDELYELAKVDRDIIIVSADMGAPSLDKFRTNLPSQFVHTGIAEQNSILVASGLAKEGKKVFVYAIASFLTLNCIEKIRVQNSMMNFPINLVGVGAGFSYPDSGPTHHLLEDISVMRALPNITIYSPADSNVSKALARNFNNLAGTNYFRLERQPRDILYKEDVILEDGMSELVHGEDLLIISTGITTSIASEIIENNKNLSIGLLDIFKIPLNKEKLIEIVSRYKKVLTYEEHFLEGGLGSAILEVLSDNEVYVPVKRVGIPVSKGFSYTYGGREEIHKYYEIDKETVESKIRNWIL
ncbi:transketolase family protein [Halobacteriovorax sp. HLS]|uniref:transketolase family protein n=1 Tax=Halobacteriovorax sp. HLS TaxID=2234000 RepID=UPI000FD76A25|nr:transketolase C-terminal domain-containing protein [Halobacteriovorax sp. HLS]